jgi:hypothetical protein
MFIVSPIAGRIALVAAMLASQAALAGGPVGPPPLEALPPAQGAIHNGSLVSVLSLPNGGMQIQYIQPRGGLARSRRSAGDDLVAEPMEWTASWPPDRYRVRIHR